VVRRAILGIVVAIALGLAQAPAISAEPASYAFGVDLNSKYYWRGFLRADDFSTQPYAQCSYMDFTAGVRANKSVDYEEADEVDLSLSYGTNLGNVRTTLGYTNYQFIGLESTEFESTNELYVQASTETGPVSPTIAIYHDWDAGDGTYIAGGMDKSFPAGNTSIGLGAMVGYNSSYFLADYSGFSHGALRASWTVPFGTGFALTSNVTLNKSFDTDIFEDQTVFGIGLGWGN
jgi:hypothetical protein